jgi:protein-S-isoprenylcysteine O-methyltransferase Ste14
MCRDGRPPATRAPAGLTSLVILPAVLLASAAAIVLGRHSPTRIAGAAVPAADLAVMWLGLVVRTWAIGSLGRSFRTTVEVDQGQAVVAHGPYRWIRHPSYAGVLLITLGYGLALDNWIALALTTVVPAIAMLRRITVEERALVDMLGAPHTAYRARTHRLVPRVW